MGLNYLLKRCTIRPTTIDGEWERDHGTQLRPSRIFFSRIEIVFAIKSLTTSRRFVSVQTETLYFIIVLQEI